MSSPHAATASVAEPVDLEALTAAPSTLEEAGLSETFVSDLLVKTLYVRGATSGQRLELFLRLPFLLLDDELLTLQHRRMVEVRGTQGHGRRGYTFDLTGEGRTRAREILQTSRYVGPAPVPMEEYEAVMRHQGVRHARVGRDDIHHAFRHLVFDDELLDALGPAVNSGRSLFLYGEAGNGKTSIAETIAELLGGEVLVPYGVEAEGHIISIFDPVAHREAAAEADPAEADLPGYLRPVAAHDPRYVRIRRPVVMTGGELTLDQLELQFDEQAGAFRAPPQVRANGGVLIIDDFGRQRVRPRDLLNRWMVPLERHTDFLGLPMGQKLPLPFECLLIFATNLDPKELVEEAFLRRIRYKILVDDPTREQYEEIWRRSCEAKGLAFSPEHVDFIFDEFYARTGVEPRACHPRDIVNHLCDMARYLDVEPRSSRELIEAACRYYFVHGTDEGGPETGANGREDGA